MRIALGFTTLVAAQLLYSQSPNRGYLEPRKTATSPIAGSNSALVGNRKGRGQSGDTAAELFTERFCTDMSPEKELDCLKMTLESLKLRSELANQIVLFVRNERQAKADFDALVSGPPSGGGLNYGGSPNPGGGTPSGPNSGPPPPSGNSAKTSGGR